MFLGLLIPLGFYMMTDACTAEALTAPTARAELHFAQAMQGALYWNPVQPYPSEQPHLVDSPWMHCRHDENEEVSVRKRRSRPKDQTAGRQNLKAVGCGNSK